MFEAAGKARDGDVGYFQALPVPELASLLVGRDEDGRTLLHTAAAAGHLELLQLLIAAGSGKVASKHDDEVRLQFAACMHARVCRLRHQATGQGWAGWRIFAPAHDQSFQS